MPICFPFVSIHFSLNIGTKSIFHPLLSPPAPNIFLNLHINYCILNMIFLSLCLLWYHYCLQSPFSLIRDAPETTNSAIIFLGKCLSSCQVFLIWKLEPIVANNFLHFVLTSWSPQLLSSVLCFYKRTCMYSFFLNDWSIIIKNKVPSILMATYTSPFLLPKLFM